MVNERVKLAEVASIRGGKRLPAGKDFTTTETPHPYIRARDIGGGKVEIHDAVFLDEGTAHTLRRYTVNKGDVCLTIVGANVGKMGVVPPHLDGANLTENAVKIVSNGKADQTFLKYALLGDDAMGQMKVLAGGAAQPKLGIYKIETIEFPFPPLPVQRRIAGILSAYDEWMENSQRRIRLLEAMARALYREWFVHFRFPGHNTKSSASDNSPDFVSGMLGDLCGLTKDTYDDAVHSELPLLDLAHMPSRTLAPQDTGHPSELTTSRIVFKKNDTLFGAIRCYLHKVVAAHYSGVTNTSVLVLRPKRPCFRSLLAIIASDAETIRWAEAQSTGTKMPVINWGIFQKMPAPVPSAGLAQEFENIAGPMLDQIGVHAIQIQNLRRTRDLLLPRLLSGQVQIPNTN